MKAVFKLQVILGVLLPSFLCRGALSPQIFVGPDSLRRGRVPGQFFYRGSHA
jgi:hypothetical protein